MLALSCKRTARVDFRSSSFSKLDLLRSLVSSRVSQLPCVRVSRDLHYKLRSSDQYTVRRTETTLLRCIVGNYAADLLPDLPTEPHLL